MRKVLKYLRFHPFDISDERGRSDERYRLSLFSSMAIAINKFFLIAGLLFGMKFTLPYLGVERFGVWVTISSLYSVLVFLDFGVGNALTNRISNVKANCNPRQLSCSISGGIFSVAILGFFVSALLTPLFLILPIENLIKVHDPFVREEIKLSFLVFSIIFGLSFFTAGVQKIYGGLQMAYISNCYAALGSLTSILLLWISATQKFGIVVLLLVTFLPQVIISIALLWILYRRKLFSFVNAAVNLKTEFRVLIRVGFVFFALQIGIIIGWSLDSLMISSIIGASQVAVYAAAQRLFQFMSQPFSIINTPLWAAYSDAYARKDKYFIKNTLFKSLLFSFVFCIPLGALLFGFGGQIIEWWTDNKIIVPTSVLLCFFIWTIFEVVGGAFAMFLNGCHVLKPQLKMVFLLLIIGLPVKIYFIKSHGLIGLMVSWIFVYVISTILVYGFTYKKTIQSVWI